MYRWLYTLSLWLSPSMFQRNEWKIPVFFVYSSEAGSLVALGLWWFYQSNITFAEIQYKNPRYHYSMYWTGIHQITVFLVVLSVLCKMQNKDQLRTHNLKGRFSGKLKCPNCPSFYRSEEIDLSLSKYCLKVIFMSMLHFKQFHKIS